MVLEPSWHSCLQFAIGMENVICKAPQKAFQVPSVSPGL